MPKPNQVPKLNNFEGMDPVFSQHYSQLIDTVNTLAGYSGDIQLASHLDLGGNRIKNVGTPVDVTDAVSNAFANSKFSASALRPQLESTGSQPMQSMRRLNDPNQRELRSSHLNDLMSSVPNANQIFPTMVTMGGGVQVTINASLFRFADGSFVNLQGRTDLLSFPATFTISSISSSGSVVTVVTTAPSGLTAGSTAFITGVTPSSFNGLQLVSSVTLPDTFTYQDSLGTLTGSGGTVELGGVYYYSVSKRSSALLLSGPFPSDSPTNRIDVNFDGNQIVAVVIITASGGVLANSGGGGTATTGSPLSGTFA